MNEFPDVTANNSKNAINAIVKKGCFFILTSFVEKNIEL